MPLSKRDTRYPLMDCARSRSLPRGIPPLSLIVIKDIILIVLVRILHWGIQGEDVLLLVVLPFIEAFQRRFEGLHIFLILLNVLEWCGEDRVCCSLIPGGESSRRGKGLLDCWYAM